VSPAREPEFGLVKSLVFSATLIVLLLGAAELAIRGWALYARDDVERWDAKTATFELTPGEYRSEYAASPASTRPASSAASSRATGRTSGGSRRSATPAPMAVGATRIPTPRCWGRGCAFATRLAGATRS
jgi:hypothetical protein